MMRKTLCITLLATSLVWAGKNDPIAPAAQARLREIRTLAANFSGNVRAMIAAFDANVDESAEQLNRRLASATAARNLLERSPLRKWAQCAQGCGLTDLLCLQVNRIPADAAPLQIVDAAGHQLPRPAEADQAFAVPTSDMSGWVVYDRGPNRGFELLIQELTAWVDQLAQLQHLAEIRELDAVADQGAAQQ